MHRLVIIFLVVSCALSQNEDQVRKLQIAQSLEQAGQWKQAAALYEDLWRSDTVNYVYFDALRRAYAQLKDYEKAIDLIERRLRMNPGEFYIGAFLGGVHFDSGARERADSVWNAVLRVQPKQRQMYVLVAQQLQERRLFGRAIEVYRRGREATGNESDFVEELAMIHSATQEYGEAVEEYLRLLKRTPHQLSYVQSRIASFTLRDEGLRQARKIVATAAAQRPNDVPVQTLLAWIQMEQDDYAAALETYRTVDKLSGSKGVELYTFAERASRGKKFAEAGLAYDEVAAVSPANQLRPRALLGLAQTMEMRSDVPAERLTGASLSGGRVPESVVRPDSALRLYGLILAEYPDSPPAFEAQYRIGLIRFEKLFDLDGALRAFERVRTARRAGSRAWDALLMSADVLTAKGDLAGASKLLADAPSEARQYLQEKLVLKKARILYLAGFHGEAQTELAGVISALTRDGANDGLDLYYHLLEGMLDSASLAMYARAELLMYQRKFTEAYEFFRRAGETTRMATLASRSRLQSAEMLVRLGRPVDAVTVLDSVVSTFRGDVLLDRAAFRIGEIYLEELKDKEKALQSYERFLAAFPNSLYAEEARKKVRSLRKDAL